MIQDIISKIEKDNGFYSLFVNNIPIWDGIRYEVIEHLIAQRVESPVAKLNNQGKVSFPLYYAKEFVRECLSYISLLYVPHNRHKDFIFFISSRSKDGHNSYDRQAAPILSRIPSHRRVIIEYQTGARYPDRNYCDFAPLFYRLRRKSYKGNDQSVSSFIANRINDEFGENIISPVIISSMIERFRSNCKAYLKLLGKIRPQKIIISYGRFKAICYAAKQFSIPVCLLQHALVFENDFALANTCPERSLGYFPDVFYTYGSFWGQYMKNLTDVRVLGNQYLSKAINNNGTSLLFISTSQQGLLLSPIVKQFALYRKDVHCIYRLHPAEYHLKSKYLEFFSGLSNVQVVTNEASFEDNLSNSKIVVGIFSTALYEALNQKRLVAVLENKDYDTYLSNLRGLDNVYFFRDYLELSDIESQDYKKTTVSFFESLREDALTQILYLPSEK